MGVSPRRLGGWEPRQFTQYFYDKSGRLESSVTTTEPHFTPTDVSALLAVRAQDAEVGPHGYPMSEALDPASEGKFEGHVKTDHIAAALITAQDRYYEQYPNAKRGAHHWTASRIEPK